MRMSEEKTEIVKSAIQIFDEVYTNIYVERQKERPSDMEKSLRQRSREFPSLIQEIGLIGALSFCFSKGNKFYPQVLNVIRNKQSEKLKDETDVGYALYMYFILRAIEHVKILEIDYINPYDAIKKLSNNLDKVRIIERLIMPYLVEIKRLCEGSLITGEKR
jgi:CRISPR type III-B/RAMP module-associated protein Cmr5